MNLRMPIIFVLIYIAIVIPALWLAWPTDQVITITTPQGANSTVAVTAVDSYSGVNPEQTQSALNVLAMFFSLLIMTVIMLVLVKFKTTRLMMVIAVGLGYILSLTIIFARIGIPAGDTLALIFAIIFTSLNFIYPRWWLVDITGYLLAIGASALIGVALGIVPVLMMLVFLAIYDVISVYKTKHMTALAKGIMDSGTPFALFIIPKPHEKGTVNVDLNQPRERISVNIIGLGDYIIPIVLVISANKFIRDATIYSLSIPAIGAAIGGMIGYVLLAWIAEKHPTAHAGLPPINGCAITGFLIACALTGSWGWI